MYIFRKNVAVVLYPFRDSMETRQPHRRRKYTLARPFQLLFLIHKLMKLSTFSQDYKQGPVTYKALYFVEIALV